MVHGIQWVPSGQDMQGVPRGPRYKNGTYGQGNVNLPSVPRYAKGT